MSETKNENTNYPLILVFYLDAEMMKVKEIIEPFAESVNAMLLEKNANAMAFFMPTTGEDRVECINPMQVKEADMAKINTMIEDFKKNFMVDIKEEDIVMQEGEIPGIQETECKCDGDCECNKEDGCCGGNCDCNKNEE